ncbi:MAG: peptidase E [Rickettsiales bacterium]|jgi:dipeptidase E|nr:peptidase E [Rickettsiales bacterium]
MKAILCSTNITKIDGGTELVERILAKPRGRISVAVINEASAVEFGDHRFVADTLRDLADTFGGNIEIVHLLALSPDQIRERISAAGILFVLGGNTEWLKQVFDKTGFSEMLPKILDEKLYIGSSAGSMVLGHLPSYKNQDRAYGPAPHFGVAKYLDLVDFSILPHFHASYLNDTGDDWAIEESKSVDYPVYAISDTAAVVVDGAEVSVIGEDWKKLAGGREV